MSVTQGEDGGALAIRRCMRKSLKKIDDQPVELHVRPISGPVEERIAVAAVKEGDTSAVLLLAQAALTAIGVIVAARAIGDKLEGVVPYVIAAAVAYTLPILMMQSCRGRRIAVRAVLDYRINRTSAVHAASSGGDH